MDILLSLCQMFRYVAQSWAEGSEQRHALIRHGEKTPRILPSSLFKWLKSNMLCFAVSQGLFYKPCMGLLEQLFSLVVL